VVLPFVFIIGCSSKNYYEPTESKSLSYDESIEDIIKKNIDIIQLEDGTVITNKFLKFKLPDDEKILNYIKQTDSIASISDDFVVKIYNNSGKKVYEKKFNEIIVTAALSKNLFIVLTATNKVKLFDIHSNNILFEEKFDKSYSVNSRIATPFFSDKLVAIPTLDGRLVFITQDGRMVKNNPISNKPSFNNIIFLDVIDGDIVTVTPTRAISIFDGGSKKIDEKFKEVIVVDNYLYFFTNDGKIIQTDSKLNTIKEKKYKFAIFSQSGSDGKFIYTAEKTGYLIVNKKDLSKDVVYDIADIDSEIFINKTHIFYDGDMLKLDSIPKP